MEIKVHVEGADEVIRQLERAPGTIRKQAGAIIRAAALALMRRVKSEMPVDSGRARASWGVWTPGDLAKPNPDATRADAHYEERDGGLTVSQGSNVGYVAGLNQGSSRQAPAGFIDKGVEVAQRALVEAVGKMLKEVLG